MYYLSALMLLFQFYSDAIVLLQEGNPSVLELSDRSVDSYRIKC